MSRQNSFWFLFVLLGVMLVSGCETSRLSGEAESRGDDAVVDMIYFVPEEADLIEAELNPDILSSNEFLVENNLTLLAISDWETAANQIANTQAQALLIHHAALASVNQAELQVFFEEKGLVVAGIGIPGLELAKFLGHPALFTSTWSVDDGYTTPYYFYVYSLEISGSQAEIDRLQALGWRPGETLPPGVVVSDSVGVGYGASTDSLPGNGRITSMFSLITSHGQNREPYTSPSKATAVVEGAIKIDRDHLPPVVNPETGEVEDYLLVPLLTVPTEFYVAQPVDAPLEGLPGYPVARLADAQAEAVQEVALFVAEDGTFAEGVVGFGILSSIRYTLADGRFLTISTTHLSPAALAQTISFSGRIVNLPSYGEAWLDTDVGLPTSPRSLNFVKDDFIITVTGELSVDELLVIADQLLFE
ncbi:MAG: hypothetical protein IPJ90_09640 [Anaerolineaceae bacterium]|nr:hypothetical protein [Anaerolineaceae bacterium]